MNTEQCYLLGKIVKTHGIKGQVVVFLDVDNPEEYNEMDSVFVEMNRKLVPFFINYLNLYKKNQAIVKFEDIDSIEQASDILQCNLYLPLETLPEIKEEDNFYLHEIIGFQIVDQEKGNLGTVHQVFDTGNQHLINMLYQEKEVLIPLNEQIVSHLNRQTQELFVKLPEGLIEIYLED